ncbi:hypothetical protein VK92_15595 [Burkholderia sp. LK4]|nr:hypothetical protein VL00_05965 [Burkholderia cepacia]KMN59593.1 hypothetical protein VK92_15595 [Burkholderia sp. LK4]
MRYETDVTYRGRVAHYKVAHAMVCLKLFLQRLEADINPVTIPVRFLFVREPDGLAQILKNAKVIHRMDIASNLECHGAYICSIFRGLGKKSRGRMHFV